MDHDAEQNTTIVLTTYHTMSAEWRNNKIVENSTLFKRRWKRVILDEGEIAFLKRLQQLATDPFSTFHSQCRLSNGASHLCS